MPMPQRLRQRLPPPLPLPLTLPLPFPAGFLFYMLLSGGLDSLVADPSKVTALFSICLLSICCSQHLPSQFCVLPIASG